ncbi:MAG: hypothetical protein AB2L14_20900 [Candidatus Xenobiia bacterium LiM19]
MNPVRHMIFTFLLFTLIVLSIESCPTPVEASAFKPVILNSDNIKTYDQILKKQSEGSCVILQLKPEMLNDEIVKVLLSWVSRGGVLWFYDSRMASKLGMQPLPFEAKDFPVKTMEGEFGSEKKFPGVAVGCEATGNHSLTIGVRKAMVFTLQVENGKYSAVRIEEGVTPLLKVQQKDLFALAAIKSYGEGFIIFKPLLWPDQYDGGSFQRKLIKFSSKKEVPFYQ